MKKYVFIGLLAASVSLGCFGQKCVKFVDYQNKTINTKGLNLQVMGQPAGVGATEVSTLQRAASDQLQQLDLLQYNICEQLKNIKTDFMREKLQAQYTNLLMKMMNLQNAGGGSSEVAEFAQQVTEQQGGNKQQAQKRQKQGENVTPDPTPTPTPVPAPTPDQLPTPAPVVFDDDDVMIDITFPCSEFVTSGADNVIRASGMETSMDANIAKRGARTSALEDLATKIEVTVKSVTEDYFLRTQKNLTEEIEKRLEGKTQTSVSRTLTGVKTVCEKNQINKSNKNFTCYMALEINTDSVLKPVFDELKQDADVKNALPNYEKFKDTFEQVMSTYDGSF
jgi:hypothetical protein